MSEFRTKRLALATYLHATRTLPYLRAEADQDGRVSFSFNDEQGVGAQLEIEFDRGAQVPAVNLFSSQTYMRRQIAAAQNGESHNASSRRR